MTVEDILNKNFKLQKLLGCFSYIHKGLELYLVESRIISDDYKYYYLIYRENSNDFIYSKTHLEKIL